MRWSRDDWRRRFLLAILIACMAALGLQAGCGGGSSVSPVVQATTARGPLHGDWGGLLVEGGNRTVLRGSIVQVADAETFYGTFDVDGTAYSMTCTLRNGAVQATLQSPLQGAHTILWTGGYAGGRLTGNFSRRSSTSPESSSGSSGLIKFLDIQGNIQLGPWLLYGQDNTNHSGNMTVRIGVKDEDSPSAKVKATDTTTQQVYGPLEMSLHWQKDYTHDVDTHETLNVYQATFSSLPSNRLFEYTVTIYDDKHKDGYSVDASFRTPPSQSDIASGAATSQVFYSYGDNRRLWDTDFDNLPYVEERLCQHSDLTTDPMAQTCIVHTGDAATIGQAIEFYSIEDLWHHVGWRYEWLKSSDNAASSTNVGTESSSQVQDVDLRYHTWLRASLPTFMAAGNHDGKSDIGQEGFKPKDFHTFGNLVAGVHQDADHYLKLNDPYDNGEWYDTYTYAVDYGGIRIITVNVYNCFSESDATALKDKLRQWMDEVPASTPIIVNIHVAIYGAKGTGAKDGPNYYQHKSLLQTDLKSVVDGRKNVTVVAGHVHETCRTKQDDVNYYVLGTGGAPDMGPGEDDDLMIDLNGEALQFPQNEYFDFAWGVFTVDLKNRSIAVKIKHTDGKHVDDNSWTF